MLPKPLGLLNNGTFIKVNYHGSNNDNHGKILILLGIIPEEKLCYICNEDAVHDFNNRRLCDGCFKYVEKIKNTNTSYVHRNDKLISDDKVWLSKKHLDQYVKFTIIKYKSKNPKNMLKMIYLGGKTRIGESACTSCWQEIDWPCGGDQNSYFFRGYYSCLKCFEKAKNYFDLQLITYWFLKILLNDDIAKHTVLYYFEIKLRNC
jgi:hypothetical protein